MLEPALSKSITNSDSSNECHSMELTIIDNALVA